VLPVSEAVTNAILSGFLHLQPVKVAVRVQDGWIEATICDRAARTPHRSPGEPLRAWAVADRAVGRRVVRCEGPLRALVTLRRCIPRRLLIVDAPGPIGAVETSFPSRYDGHYPTPGIARG
jgi:hypothetical protein